MNDWTCTIYTYSCQFFVHSLIEFHFYAFYSSLSLKQAEVWRAISEKHNHGALCMVPTGSDESNLRTFQGPSQDQISGYKDFYGEFHNADI